MKNQDPSTSLTKPLPSLPPEIILKILNMAIDAPRCLVKELCNEYHCEGFQEETTVIYTRGHPDETGRFSRGHIAYLPVQHLCIFDAPVADQVPRDFLRVPGDSSWDDELWRHHIATRMHVFERKWRPGIVDEVIAEGVPHNRVPLLAVTESDYFDMIPFHPSVTFFEKKLDPNARPYIARLTADDSLLECQHMRHLMIKGRWGRSTEEMKENTLKGRDLQLHPVDELAVTHAIKINLRFHAENVLRVNWALMANLETLFIDLTSIEPDLRKVEQAELFRKMARHLNLKTFVVAGAHVNMDVEGAIFDDPDVDAHENMSNEELTTIWVGMLEDNPMVDYCRSYVHFFKECLRPGGQLHLIFDAEPGSYEWPVPDDIISLSSDQDPAGEE